MQPRELPAQWRAAARTCEVYGAGPTAETLERCAAELEAALQTTPPPTLTLQEAAQVSGYSVDHLGRLVREGTVPNHGRKGAPRVLAAELPRRAIAPLPTATYDPLADARALRSRRSQP